MHANKPLVIYCIRNIDCPLLKAIRSVPSLGGHHELDEGSDGGTGFREIIGGDKATSPTLCVLRVNALSDDYTEIWVRMSGDNHVMNELERKLRETPEVYFQQIYSNKFNRILRILVSKRSYCSKRAAEPKGDACPLVAAPIGAMSKTVVLTPLGILYEFIIARSSALEELRRWGCKIIHSHSIDEYAYMLTEKQELAIIYAYFMGYYSFPRRISLKQLAESLGLSVSTLAELLRRAESKIIDAFVRHELPQYLVGRMLQGEHQMNVVEKRLGSKHGLKRGKAGVGESVEEPVVGGG